MWVDGRLIGRHRFNRAPKLRSPVLTGDVPKPANWVGLIGDETAVPIIARALENFPEGTQGKAILFVSHGADMTELPRPPGVELQRIAC